MPPPDPNGITTPSSTRQRNSEVSNPPAVEVSLNLDRVAVYILIFCVVVEILFVILDYHVNYGRLTEIGAVRRLFNSTREDGLASWFATTQTLLMALTLWLIYVVSKRRSESRWKNRSWLLLAVFFTYVAIDDGALIHERVGSAYETMSESKEFITNRFPSYAWQVLFLPFFALMGLFVFTFLWRELRARNSKILLIIAVCSFGLAIVLDFIEGLDPDHAWNLHSWLAEEYELSSWTLERFDEFGYEAVRHFSKSIEETLEMFANTLLWFLIIRHLSALTRALHFRFDTSTSA